MRLIDADALERQGLQFETHGGATFIALGSVRTAPTIDPEELRPKGRWENGACTVCGFDLRCLTDGENDLEQWVWDEGFDYCPGCGAKMEVT